MLAVVGLGDIPLWAQILAVPLLWATVAVVLVVGALASDMVRVYLGKEAEPGAPAARIRPSAPGEDHAAAA